MLGHILSKHPSGRLIFYDYQRWLADGSNRPKKRVPRGPGIVGLRLLDADVDADVDAHVDAGGVLDVVGETLAMTSWVSARK